MKRVIFFIFVMVLTSCSQAPLSVSPAEELFTEIPLDENLIKPVSAFKTEPKNLEDWLNQEEKKTEMSLRRVYFRAYYAQQIHLAQWLEIKTEQLACPQFHHDRLIIDEQQSISQSQIPQRYPLNSHLSYFPEWSLSMKHEGKRVSADLWGQQKKLEPPSAYMKALKRYYHKRQKELMELCEEGYSENYFKYENIVTYYSSHSSFISSSKGIKALTKIPIFSHLFINQDLGKLNVHEKLALERTKIYQLEQYLVELKRSRNALAQK